VIKDRGILAINWNIAESVKCFPRNSGWIGDPVLIRPRVAARLLVLLNQSGVGRFQLPMQSAQFLGRVDLKAQVIDAGGLTVCGNGKIYARILEHPLGVVGLHPRRLSPKQRRIEPDALREVMDGNMNVESFHADFLLGVMRLLAARAPGLQTGVAQAPLSACPQQFSVR